jgi:hypothetical protein
VLGQIDVCVGDAKVKCGVRRSPDTLKAKELRGNLLVAECIDPRTWLPKLAQLRRDGGADQIVVALPAETASLWFKAAQADAWCWCFVTDVLPPLLLGHLGHHHGFAVTLADVGVILQTR